MTFISEFNKSCAIGPMMSIILTLFLTVSVNGFLQPNITFSALQEQYIGNLLKVYEDFTFVFHVENASFEYLRSIYGQFKSNVHQTMLIYNYDSGGKENIMRQYGATFLNLVIMEDIFKFERFSKDPGRMAVNDIVLLFLYGNYNGEDMEKWVKMGQHVNIGNILILDLRISNWITLNSTLFYSVKGTKLIDILESTNSTEVKIPRKLLLQKDFKDLRGHLLHIGYVDYFPYIYCLDYEKSTLHLGKDEVKVCRKAIGVEAELLKVLSVRMNFTYKLVNYPGQSHAFVFSKVVERRVDFVIGGITRTYNRVLNATFTISHIIEGYTFLYIYSIDPKSYLLIFFFPFEWELWLFILFIVVLISFLTYVIINYGSDASQTKITIYRSTIASMNATIEQGVNLPPKYFKQKHILYALYIVWWFSCIWLATFYKGKLSSFYVKPPHKEPTSLQRLIEGDYEIIVNKILAERIQDIYQHKHDETINEAAKRTTYISGICQVINYILTHKAAMLTEFAAAKYDCQIKCPDLIGPYKKIPYKRGSLRIVAKPLVVIPHGWPLPKGTPFTFTINMYKLRLRDAGFIVEWIRLSVATGGLWSIQSAQDNSAVRSTNDQVSIALYLSAFLILVVGQLLSIIAFAIELQTGRRKRKSPPK